MITLQIREDPRRRKVKAEEKEDAEMRLTSLQTSLLSGDNS